MKIFMLKFQGKLSYHVLRNLSCSLSLILKVILQGFLRVQIPRDPGMRTEMNIQSVHILCIFISFPNQGHPGISACRVQMEGRITWGGRSVLFGKNFHCDSHVLSPVQLMKYQFQQKLFPPVHNIDLGITVWRDGMNSKSRWGNF